MCGKLNIFLINQLRKREKSIKFISSLLLGFRTFRDKKYNTGDFQLIKSVLEINNNIIITIISYIEAKGLRGLFKSFQDASFL